MNLTADAHWHWQSQAAFAQPNSSLSFSLNSILSPNLGHWLQDTGSLTVRLRLCCQEFRVQLLSTRAKVPLSASQADWLGEAEGYCREVLLLCDNVPWVYASSLYSPESLAAVPALGGLGEKALGELMFERPDLTRSQFEFAQLNAACYQTLLQQLAPKLPTFTADPNAINPRAVKPEPVRLPWARRSVLAIPKAKVLVTELFLPAASAYRD